ncbi:MAG TPA: response regulator [Rectinemataceae bacterium]|nr:response regulator [Rectinemataceae bacterium]
MKSLKMLVAEDEFLSRHLLMRMIQSFGTVDAAVDGAEAIVALKTAYQAGTPYDLVFLDIMMPTQDGQTTLLELRSYEEGIGIPPADGCKVIMVTALGDAKNVMAAFKNQCEGYVTKPYSMEAIKEIVTRISQA